MNKAPLTCFESWPSFMLIGRLLSEIDHPPYFLYRIMCDPLLNLPEYTKYSSHLNLGEGVCICTSFHFPDSGLYLLDGFYFYFDLF